MDAAASFDFYESFRAPKYFDFAKPEDPVVDDFFDSLEDWSLLDKCPGQPDGLQQKETPSKFKKHGNSRGSTPTRSQHRKNRPAQATGESPHRNLLRTSAAHNATVKYSSTLTIAHTRGYGSEAGTAKYSSKNASASGALLLQRSRVPVGASDKDSRNIDRVNASDSLIRGGGLTSGSPRPKRANELAEECPYGSNTAIPSGASKHVEPGYIRQGREKENSRYRVSKTQPIGKTASTRPLRSVSCLPRTALRRERRMSGRAASAPPTRSRREAQAPEKEKAVALDELRSNLEKFRISRTSRVAEVVHKKNGGVLQTAINKKLGRSAEWVGEGALRAHRAAEALSRRLTQTLPDPLPDDRPVAPRVNGHKQEVVKEPSNEASKASGEHRVNRHRRSESVPVMHQTSSSFEHKPRSFLKRSTKTLTVPVSPKLGARKRVVPAVSVSMNESVWKSTTTLSDRSDEDSIAECERLRKVAEYRRIRASTVRSKVPPTKPKNIVLHIDKRAVVRSTFDMQVAEQRRQAEEEELRKKRELEQEEAKELWRMRNVEMIPIAQHMPMFDVLKPFKPLKSTKPPTKAISPKLGRRSRVNDR